MRPRSRSLDLLVVGIGLLFSSQSSAAGELQTETARRAQAAELYDLSGLDPVVAIFGETVVQSLAQGAHDIPKGVKEQLAQAARHSFSHSRLRDEVVARMEERLDPRLAKRTKSWLGSPLGQRIIQLEMDSATPEGLERINQTMLEFTQKSPPQSRVSLVRGLVDAMGIDEFSEKLLAGTSLAIASAANAYNPRPLGFEDVKAAVDRV